MKRVAERGQCRIETVAHAYPHKCHHGAAAEVRITSTAGASHRGLHQARFHRDASCIPCALATAADMMLALLPVLRPARGKGAAAAVAAMG